MNVEWRTGIGYGDFVTGLGYARNLQAKNDVDVNIKFHWIFNQYEKYSPNDPETLYERFEYINSILVPNTNITYQHEFKSTPSFRFHNQLDEFNYLHGLSRTTLPTEKKNLVVVWTTRNNIEFPGEWKDPVHKDWSLIINILKHYGYEVVEVDYRTPIKEVIELIRVCKFGIGYDGLIHQLFKFMWKPLIVFCKRTELNKLLMPWAHLMSSVNDFVNSDINEVIELSNVKMNTIDLEYSRYLRKPFDFDTHPLYNKTI